MTTADIRPITLLIQKHMLLLGSTAALSRARRISGITVAENGEILRITRDPRAVYTELENAYAAFAGTASRILSSAMRTDRFA